MKFLPNLIKKYLKPIEIISIPLVASILPIVYQNKVFFLHKLLKIYRLGVAP